ncbi:hypothetical protein [Flavobacterium sp.]|uniref:hypothetical protein n=1 Tax=Flavobacterium sp. TaxID=239 RepID=UPI0025DC1D47|nr:hypothetical protein [Flavobacterium sp.]
MKKNKSQFYQLLISLICLFLIGITFSSCEAEKDVAKDNKIIVKKCSMKDFKLRSDIKLNEAANYLNRLQAESLQQNANSKLVYDENSGLFYDDEKGIYISKDGKESYTFPIIQSDSTVKIKNITFNKNTSNAYDVYIVNYDYTKEDLSNYTKEELNQREIKYQALLKNGVEYPVEAQSFVCIDITIVITWIEEHPNEPADLECTDIITSHECVFNSGGISSGNNGTGSENGSGSSQDNSITTTPIDDGLLVLPPTSKSPCRDLADLSKPNSGDMKPEINWLKTKLDETKEFGVEVEKSPNPNPDGTYNYPKTEKESDESNHVELSFGEYVIGAAHCHPSNITYAIPSFGDLKWLKDCVSHVPPFRQKDVFTMIVCKDAAGIINTYAIKITNLLAFTTKVNDIWNSPKYSGKSEKQKIEAILNKQAKKYKSTNNQTPLLEKTFLEEFSEFGIDILKATDDNLDNWETLKLDSSQPSGVKSVPCTNN